MRLLVFLLVSLALGTFAAWKIPAWQRLVLVPGESREIDVWSQPVELTVADASQSKTYVEFDAATAVDLANRSALSASEGITLRNPATEITPMQVVWTTSTKHRTSTHHAPGLRVRLRATAEVTSTPASGSAAVRWGGEVWEKVVRQGRVQIRHGRTRVVDNHLLLARYEVDRDAAARTAAIWQDAVLGGAPFTLVAFVLLVSLCGFPAKAPALVEPLVLPATFRPNYAGNRMVLALFGGVGALLVGVLGFTQLASAGSLVDLPLNLRVNAGAAAAVLAILGLVLSFTLRSLRTVHLHDDHLEVRGGPGERPLLEVPWSEVQAAPGERYRRGTLVGEWLDITPVGRRRVRISRQHVQDFAVLRNAVLARVG